MSGNAALKVAARAARQARAGRRRPARRRRRLARVGRQPSRAPPDGRPRDHDAASWRARRRSARSCPTATARSRPRSASSTRRPAAAARSPTTRTARTPQRSRSTRRPARCASCGYVACHDVGRAIHMQRVEGQIEGAVAQGVGYALARRSRSRRGLHVDAVRRLPDPHVAGPPRHPDDRARDPSRQGPAGRPRRRRAADRPAGTGARRRDPRRDRRVDDAAADDAGADPRRDAGARRLSGEQVLLRPARRRGLERRRRGRASRGASTGA